MNSKVKTGISIEKAGYPSIDKPWLKYYKENAEEEANNIPMDKTVWDVIDWRSE